MPIVLGVFLLQLLARLPTLGDETAGVAKHRSIATYV
jgi:hypothetical protein